MEKIFSFIEQEDDKQEDLEKKAFKVFNFEQNAVSDDKQREINKEEAKERTREWKWPEEMLQKFGWEEGTELSIDTLYRDVLPLRISRILYSITGKYPSVFASMEMEDLLQDLLMRFCKSGETRGNLVWVLERNGWVFTRRVNQLIKLVVENYCKDYIKSSKNKMQYISMEKELAEGFTVADTLGEADVDLDKDIYQNDLKAKFRSVFFSNRDDVEICLGDVANAMQSSSLHQACREFNCTKKQVVDAIMKSDRREEFKSLLNV